MFLDPAFHLGQFARGSREQRFKRGFHQAVGRVAQPVLLLELRLQQVIAVANQCSQALLLLAGRLPETRLVFGTETGNDRAIELVGLVALHGGHRVALDASGIDHTDVVALGMQPSRQGLPVDVGGFHTGVQRRSAERGQPGGQFGEAFGGVGERSVVLSSAAHQQRGIKAALGQVNPENVHWRPPWVEPNKQDSERVRGQPCMCFLAKSRSAILHSLGEHAW